MYTKCGSLEDAIRVFNRLLIRDVVTWNCMIAEYLEHRRSQEALSLHISMQDQGIGPTIPHFPGSLGHVLMLEIYIRQGSSMHTSKQEDLRLMHLLATVWWTCTPNVVVCRMLAYKIAYKRCGDMDCCDHASHGLGQEALSLYARMQEDGRNLANSVTFVCPLQACASIGALHQEEQLV